ncbi:MAG: hypothetical protein GX769_04275 [Erysipelothrix sp.]|nr:hypothetical protein [Erysipelothrix sp.]
MKLGYFEKIITPEINIDLVGFVPSRISKSIEKDLFVKVISLKNNNKYYSWLVCDLLGLSLYFKQRLLSKLKGNRIILDDLQIFATHTHSGPTCLNEKEYYNPKTDPKDVAYFDFLVEQSYQAVYLSIENLKTFTYKLGKSQISDFQSNRFNKDVAYDNQLLIIEVTFFDMQQLLIYSFAGHPTILNNQSYAISPDFVGEVSLLLRDKYENNIFFNAPCGEVSSRFTRKESSLKELKRLAKIAASQVLLTCENLSDKKVLANYKVKHLEKLIAYKDFDKKEDIIKQLQKAKTNLEISKQNNLAYEKLRLLESKIEGLGVYLENSQKDFPEFYLMNIYIAYFDGYKVVNIAGEIFSTLILPLKADDKTWVLALSDEYQSYLVDKNAFKDKTYEALASLYKVNEAENLIRDIIKKM